MEPSAFWTTIGKKRATIAAHMYSKGMSFEAIGILVGSSPDYIEKLVKWGADKAAKRLLAGGER